MYDVYLPRGGLIERIGFVASELFLQGEQHAHRRRLFEVEGGDGDTHVDVDCVVAVLRMRTSQTNLGEEKRIEQGIDGEVYDYEFVLAHVAVGTPIAQAGANASQLLAKVLEGVPVDEAALRARCLQKEAKELLGEQLAGILIVRGDAYPTVSLEELCTTYNVLHTARGPYIALRPENEFTVAEPLRKTRSRLRCFCLSSLGAVF